MKVFRSDEILFTISLLKLNLNKRTKDKKRYEL